MRRVLLTVVLLVLLGRWLPAAAHGGGQLIAGPQQTGPYLLSVWVNPPQPRSGELLHYTVGVADPADSAPVLDARIMVTMRLAGQDSPPVTAEATTEQSVNRLFYETDMVVEEAGMYQSTFFVTGPAGEGELLVDVDVQPPSRFNWFWKGLGGLLLILLFGWLPVRRRRAS